MEVIVLYALLCLSVNNGYGISQKSNVTQTWNEASNDSSCLMIGLNLTGEIEENIDNITSSIAWDTNQTMWIGAYAKRVWINFEGCHYGLFKVNYRWMPLISYGDPAKSCLRHCNYSRFVLVENKCVCYKDVQVIDFGCIAMKCNDSKYRYCGRRTDVSSTNITYHCMCRFSMEHVPSDLPDKGNCLAVIYKPEKQFMAINCSYKNRPLCYDPNNNGQAYPNEGSNNWLQSLSKCYDNNKQFASRTTNVTGIHNGTYWVGTFAVTYKLWGRPRPTDDNCVAINIDRTSNHLTTVVLPCKTSLPTLCSNTSVFTTITTATNIPDKAQASSNTKAQTPISTIVGSVVGTVVIIIIIVVVLIQLRRRGTFKKTPAPRANNTADNLEMSKSSKVDNTDTDDIVPNNVYNHLGEIQTKKNVSDEDLYDHTGGEGDTYGRLNSSYLHDDESEYDHTSSSTAGETYGRLNRNNHQSDNESNYDHTGDIYGRLHAGKYRDVGNDVYDSAGGSGSTYDHINIFKPEVEGEYDHHVLRTDVFNRK